MAQLKMYRLANTPFVKEPLPEGYSISKYAGDADKLAWCECCRNGLVADDADDLTFDDCIGSWEEIDVFNDVYFLDYNGEHVGTVTAFVRSDGAGDMHMVGIRSDFRGKGLAKYLSNIVAEKMDALGVPYTLLTTDEWRKSAVKSYLSAGYLPVEYDIGMQDRWEKVLEEYGIDHVQMLYEDTTPFRVIYRKSKAPKVKFGVFGAGRGRTMMNYCEENDNAVLVAVCDMRQDALDAIARDYGEDIALYTDFDEFLKHDMDCVVLANFANEHAPYAVRCLKAGKNVLSEVLPCQNMKEAVELIEAVESTGLTYAYAENYCFMPAPKKIREEYRKGTLGSFEYGEGEYMHDCEAGWQNLTYSDPKHWRNTMSAFYYCTHSFGPLVHITGLRPVSVTGFEVAYNERMHRMGALGGPIGIEMVTMENGGVCKSLHGVGPSKDSIWYSVYGSKGRMESAREDAHAGGVGTLYSICDKEPTDLAAYAEKIPTSDAMSGVSGASGHGGSDFYIMFNLVQRLRGNRNADVIDVYEALDMFLPGLFAYRSVLAGGKPMEIPDLRDPAERDKWRNDTACTDPAVAGDMLQPSYSKGNPVIEPEVYERLAAFRAKSRNNVRFGTVDRFQPKLGIQLYTLRDHIQTPEDFDSTLARLKELGVDTVQISAIGDFPYAEQKRILDKYGMKVCVTHKGWDKMTGDLRGLIDGQKIIDCPHLGLGCAPGDMRDTKEKVEELIAGFNKIGTKCAEAGLTFNYHNHDFEFRPPVGSTRTMMRMLLEDTSKKVFFIPDVAWIHFGGEDPAKFLWEMRGRINVVHFKDYVLGENGRPVFCSLGKGVVDLNECFRVCQDLRVPYIVYEQDCDWVDGDPFKSTEESWAYMKELAEKNK